MSEAEQRLKEATLANSDPDRDAAPAGRDGSSGAAFTVGGYNTFWMDRGTGALLVNGKFRTSIIVEPGNGQLPELTPQAMAQAAKFRALKNDGTAWWLEEEGLGPYDNMEQRNTAERCLLSFSGAAPSMPSLYNNFKREVQTKFTNRHTMHNSPYATSCAGADLEKKTLSPLMTALAATNKQYDPTYPTNGHEHLRLTLASFVHYANRVV